jgi:hypothetical protein
MESVVRFFVNGVEMITDLRGTVPSWLSRPPVERVHVDHRHLPPPTRRRGLGHTPADLRAATLAPASRPKAPPHPRRARPYASRAR